MDEDEKARIAELNRQAALEKKPDDPQATKPRDALPLVVMSLVGLAIAAVLLGVMWMNNPRYDGAGPQPVSERPDGPDQPSRPLSGPQ